MKNMKKCYSIVVASVATIIMWACGPAEAGFTQHFTLEGLYTVNKATVAPEFSDTFFFVNNIDDYDLKTGERAFIVMDYYYDAYSGKAGAWNIKSVKEKVPVYPLSLRSDIDESAYATPITGLRAVGYFYDKLYTWVWKERQNISVEYRGVKEGALYAMAVRGVTEDGCVEFDLFINAEESNETVSVLLTFDISNVADLLTDEQKALLPENGDIKTKIYAKRKKGDTVVAWPIDGNYSE